MTSKGIGLLGAAACATFALACGSDKSVAAGPEPTITITEPADGATVTITDDPDVPVGFSVKHFVLKDPGMCGGASGCGHVHVNVDGHKCDDHENGEVHSYTEESSTSPVGAGLDYCTDAVMGVPAARTYVFVAGLYDDDEAAVLDSSGKAVTDSIHVDVVIAPIGDGGVKDGGS